ncbi:PTTG1IP family member 2 [Tiliqua scincoides]|uniref:PTTG1IP family member 2 n=1 Tax=Tiliqua scincoides TaxID=71010 RepID=UPI0034634A5B
MEEGKTTTGAAQGLRWPLWALCLPCAVLLWSRPVAGTAPPPSTAPLVPAMPCIAFTGKTCGECVKNTKCLWCSENSTCMDYPTSKLIPPSSVCHLSEAYWAVCWFNFEDMLITMGVVAGVLLLLIVGCCCCCRYRCCCCRKSHPMGRLVEEEEERFIRDREEKRMQSLHRKHERKLKHDEIRKKYGLLQDSDHPYSRYENE